MISGVGRWPVWVERHQVALYLGTIAVAAVFGFVAPDAALPLEHAITPVLALLLYATFLGVPFARVARAVRDGRFLAVVLAVNFIVLPLVVWALSRVVAHDTALLVGVLLVLLTPCIDYVVVFTGIAGGDRERLLAATPLLMVAQIALLPAYLWLMAGPEVLSSFDARPFLEAFLLLVVLPLALAAATQAWARRARFVQGIVAVAAVVMVPLMMATLAVVVASQVSAVGGQLARLAPVALVFVFFVLIAVPVAALAARAARLDVPARRAVVFSGTTRNSLVVLPLALALPEPLAPLVVVTQTLVELVAMVALVAIVPRVIRDGGTAAEGPFRRAI
jgi:ACR3 family arsenite efflux pump ArsB